ncbi:MAG: hypothetical protein KDA32_01640 [Phycisphaerales bacterium]|nr:hypothetical protein [Phycisphaerales bacterium]
MTARSCSTSSFTVGRQWSLAAAIALCLLAGCAKQPDTRTEEATRGPISARVTVDPADPLVGDTLTITTTVTAPDEFVIDFPALAAVDGLDLDRRRIEDARPGATEGVIWTQVITTAVRKSGEVELPPTPVRYARKPADDSEPSFDNDFDVPAIKLSVRSALAGADSIDKPRDIAGVIDPPWTLGEFLYEYGGILAVALALGALVAAYVVFNRGRERKRPAIPSDVVAFRELDALAAEQLVSKGRAKDYYYRLSEIVRRYIESQFGVAAPDMTTEEFLEKTARRDALPAKPDELRRFLEACDMVKYAAFAPSAADADAALEAARTFVRDSAKAAAAQREAGMRKEAA